MLEPTPFNTILIFPILNVLVAFYKTLTFLRIPGSYGFAIIGLTALIRLLFQPFFHKQIETSRKMQELKPHLDNLSKKHKKDPKKLQAEQMKLYQEAGINPASGCLVMIVQLPVFIALYNTLSVFLRNGTGHEIIEKINSVLYHPALHIEALDPWFFGFNLASSPATAHVWYYYSIPVITGILQFFQAKATMPMMQQNDKNLPDNGKKSDKKEEPSATEDFQKAMSTQMRYMFPFMIAWFSYSLPVGLSLYWNIFSIFSIIQYRKIAQKAS